MTRPLLALALVAACGGSRPPPPAPIPAPPPAPAPAPRPPPPPPPKVPGVSLHVTPADADVYIDDKLQGKAAALPAVVPLEPGLHQLVIRADGYTAYRAEFSVSDKPEAFTVQLEPRGDAPPR